MKSKIITGDQTRKALAQIMRKTQWTLNRVSVRLGCPRQTLAKIVEGKTVTPCQQMMDSVAKLLDEVNEALS